MRPGQARPGQARPGHLQWQLVFQQSLKSLSKCRLGLSWLRARRRPLWRRRLSLSNLGTTAHHCKAAVGQAQSEGGRVVAAGVGVVGGAVVGAEVEGEVEARESSLRLEPG